MAHHEGLVSRIRGFRFGCLLLVGTALAACGSGRRSEPLIGPIALRSEQEQHGQRQYFRFCHQCHPNGDAGLGPAITNKPLPDAVIRLQIRTGVGAMPAFKEEQLPDADVDAILAYIDALKSAE